MTDKQSQLDNDSPKEEGDTKQSSPQVIAQEGGGQEMKDEVLEQITASPRPTGAEDRTSVSSETSSENDSVRSKVPHFNCPEHIVRILLCMRQMPNFDNFFITQFCHKSVSALLHYKVN